MILTRPLTAFGPVLLSLLFTIGAPGQGGLGGGGPLQRCGSCGDCISAAERLAAEQQVAAFRAAQGGGDLGASAPQPFLVYPMGGTLAEDTFIGNYVDLDASPGLLDWNCGAYTYDGHAGSDAGLRSFDEQVIGVPVFAAQDGVVVATMDGQPDMNTTWPNVPANHVILSHPGNRIGYYWHLRNGSVSVSVGQNVKAGEQIGLVGSSGVSGGPHLHFEVRDNFTAVLEPFAGACRPGPSLWAQQPAFDGTLEIRDFAISRINPGASPPPFSVNRDAQWVTSDGVIYFWFMSYNVPANTTWRVRFVRPDGVVSLDDGPTSFNNPAYQFSWWWFNWWVADMQTMTGTWTLLIDLNGVNMVTAPFEVVSAPTPGFNRAPQPITASLEPASPTPSDVLICRVGGDPVLDDLDWDVVSYGYDWKVDGLSVRTVTSAGRSDMLPHHLAQGGQVVTCDVTVSDGSLSNAPVTASALVRGLSQSNDTLSLAAGGTVSLDVDLGPSLAGAPCLMLGSLSGTSPGVPIPGGLVLPLTFDAWTQWILDHPGVPPYANTLSILDGSGRSSATFTLPPGIPPSLAGTTVHHAAFVAGTPWAVTNAVSLVTVP